MSAMVFFLALSVLLSCQGGNAQSNLRIALYVGGGVGRGDPDAYWRTLPEAAAALGDFSIENLTAVDIRERLSTKLYDVVFFPGGSGVHQAHALGKEGMEVVRAFVASGGGYVGTCGGAFLGLHHIKFYGRGPHGRGIPTKNPWARGKGNVIIEFTKKGLSDLALDNDTFGGDVTIHYAQGPIMAPRWLPKHVTILAWFRSEIHSRYTQRTKGQMVNTPAITTAQYGEGRVVLNSPHPEFIPRLPGIFRGQLVWLLKGKISTVLEPGPVMSPSKNLSDLLEPGPVMPTNMLLYM